MQRPAVAAGRDLGIGLRRLRQREIRRLGDHRPQFRVERIDALEIDAREPLGGELAGFDPARELRDRRESDVGIAGRQGVDEARLRTNASRVGSGRRSSCAGVQTVAGATSGSRAT